MWAYFDYPDGTRVRRESETHIEPYFNEVLPKPITISNVEDNDLSTYDPVENTVTWYLTGITDRGVPIYSQTPLPNDKKPDVEFRNCLTDNVLRVRCRLTNGRFIEFDFKDWRTKDPTVVAQIQRAIKLRLDISPFDQTLLVDLVEEKINGTNAK